MKLITELRNRFCDIFANATNASSSWENRPYDFYLIFGQSDENESPWITANWKSDFQPYFDLLIKQTESVRETGIRVVKYKSENRISKKDNQEFIYHSDIKLGRLKWDEKSHGKWTIPDNMESHFLNFELWNPIWTICDKRQLPPDIYITISNERDFEKELDIKFGYFIVIAIGKNLKIDSKPILKALSERINAKATVLKTRKWGKPEKAGRWTFDNSIQDTFSSGSYEGKNMHEFDFDKLEFEPVWEVIFRQR
ncbi:hypothetical protein H9X96_19950 [Pedobacter sp. N36a]|uniref:hypothetical protein n=1 Tax=Pedobacter sp. N36a TaxID=2767996 RepID=UPI001656AB55|nr:hypothetical protein [Pedobacter sp. N36a]MBC8988034.1 hypothetical protein [Pedobacter sp. N36a]